MEIGITVQLDPVGTLHTYRSKGLLMCLAEALAFVGVLYAILAAIMHPIA